MDRRVGMLMFAVAAISGVLTAQPVPAQQAPPPGASCGTVMCPDGLEVPLCPGQTYRDACPGPYQPTPPADDPTGPAGPTEAGGGTETVDYTYYGAGGPYQFTTVNGVGSVDDLTRTCNGVYAAVYELAQGYAYIQDIDYPGGGRTADQVAAAAQHSCYEQIAPLLGITIQLGEGTGF